MNQADVSDFVLPLAMFNFNSTSIPRVVQMTRYTPQSTIKKDVNVPDVHGSQDPQREELRWVTLYHHLPADGIRSQLCLFVRSHVHVYVSTSIQK